MDPPSPTIQGPGFEPDDEVDELRWCSPEDAGKLLTYEHDRALLDAPEEGEAA